MLSVGDLRNRLMALADQSHLGNPEVYDLFSYRFPKKARNWDLYQELDRIANAKDPKILKIPNPLRRIIRNHLHYFLERMPGGFDLHGASLGNLILTGGYLNNRRHIEPVIFMFSKLVEVRGIVKPITGMSYHLCARLEDGSKVIGQHLMTGKEVEAPASRIKRLYMVKSLESDEPVELSVKSKNRKLITEADLICYPLRQLLHEPAGQSSAQGCGTGHRRGPMPEGLHPQPDRDPEQKGVSMYRGYELLLHYLQESCEEPLSVNRLLDFIIVDTKNGDYAKPLHLKKISEMGIQIIDSPLITRASAPEFDRNE